MNEIRVTQTEATNKTNFSAVRSDLLQRACACGRHTSDNSGECEECKKNRPGTLQHAKVDTDSVNLVPPIVYEVLHSPGQPLDTQTTSFMGTRFGYDFSGVRIHTNEKADQSARAVDALAYTVGQNIVFGNGKYQPSTNAGRKLIAHELTHVMQQNRDVPSQPHDLAISNPRDTSEQQAERASSDVLAGHVVAPAPVSSLQLARQSASGVGGTTPVPGATPTPETTDVLILAWSGSMDLVTWAAGAVRVGELDANSIDALVDAVHTEMRNRPNVKIGRLRILGHARSGQMSPDLSTYSLTPPARQRLSELNQYFTANSVVHLEGCQVAAGMAGISLLQALSDIWGVRVTAFTDIQHALGLWGAGYQEERRPGQAIGTVTDIVVDQVKREIRETMFRTQLRVILRLEEAQRHGVLNDVVSRLQADRVWTQVVDLLTSIRVRFYPDLVDRVNALGLQGVHVTASTISMPHGFPLFAH